MNDFAFFLASGSFLAAYAYGLRCIFRGDILLGIAVMGIASLFGKPIRKLALKNLPPCSDQEDKKENPAGDIFSETQHEGKEMLADSNIMEQNAKCKFCEQLESRHYMTPVRNRMDTDNLCQCLSWGRIDGSVETGPWATISCPESCGGCADDNEHFGLFTFENRMGFSYHFKSQNLRIDRNSQMLTINFCPWCGKPLSEEIVPFEK